ncbi:MAG: hypothetical protein JNK87_23050 [Bryobacterales bacterium]|nr:hypothetical protein [Bryobacterales bacterium]
MVRRRGAAIGSAIGAGLGGTGYRVQFAEDGSRDPGGRWVYRGEDFRIEDDIWDAYVLRYVEERADGDWVCEVGAEKPRAFAPELTVWLGSLQWRTPEGLEAVSAEEKTRIRERLLAMAGERKMRLRLVSQGR